MLSQNMLQKLHKTRSSNVDPDVSSESPDYEDASLEHDAYQMLFDYIRSDVIGEEKVVRMSDMTQLLLENLMSLG